MKLNKIWGYGQLFGFSGVDGQSRYMNDCIATLMREKIAIRFEFPAWVHMKFSLEGKITFRAVMSDFIDAKTACGEFFMAFVASDSIVGYSPVLPVFEMENMRRMVSYGVEIYTNGADAFALKYEQLENGSYKFAVTHSEGATSFARKEASVALKTDIDALKRKKYAYYEKMPACKEKKYERLYYKALSVNKVNVHTAEGRIPCRWTTPDRIPHKRMWLWDSAFHALAIATYDIELAKDALRAVLSQAEEDGFISAMMNPYNHVDETQPQVLSWAVWEVYKKSGDKGFLRECVSALDGYLKWDKNNRDNNGNGLLEWLSEYGYTVCRGGEAGWDNSPRFDVNEEMDAIDFSMFQAHDSLYLSYIYEELGDMTKAAYWKGEYETLKNKINECLWCEEDGVYYDRLYSGSFSKVVTPACFMPMFARIASKEQAKKLVEKLVDENLLWTSVPLATVAKSHPSYSTDMWRGGVWLNLNYFVIKGLLNYGYTELAETLKNRTLETVNKWYKKTGAIFEFYDPEDKIAPYACERKGKPTNPPEWRKHIHSIVDFNWSACFTLLFIQNELY